MLAVGLLTENGQKKPAMMKPLSPLWHRLRRKALQAHACRPERSSSAQCLGNLRLNRPCSLWGRAREGGIADIGVIAPDP